MIKQYQKSLVINNTLMLYQADSILSNGINKLFSRYEENGSLQNSFGFSYLATNLISKNYDEDISALAENYMGKTKNQYLTSLNELTLINKESNVCAIINEDKAMLWIKRDTTFKIPKIYSYFRFLYPLIRNKDRENYNLGKYYSYYIIKKISTIFEEAKMSGNDIVGTVDENGLNIKVAGYRDVYIKIIKKIFDIIYHESSIDDNQGFDFSQRYCNPDEKSLNFLGTILKLDILIQNRISTVYYSDDILRNIIKFNSKHMYAESLIYGDIDEGIENEMKQIISKINISGKSQKIENYFPDKKNMKDILEYLSFSAEIP